jgi:hypothetical protein
MSAAISSNRTAPVATRRLPRAALLAALVSAVANAVVFFITAALGVDLTGPFMGPDSPPAPLSVVQVIIASAVPVIAAAVLFWLLARFTPRPVPIFIGIAVVFGLLSLGGPLTLPVSDGLKASLAMMHVVAGAAITYVIIRETRAARGGLARAKE